MIREATPADIPAIERQGELFFLAAGWSHEATWDRASICETLSNLIESEAATLLVAEVGGAVVGMSAAMAFPLYFNAHEMAAEELFLWVEPAHRRGWGGQLLAAMEAWAKSLGCLTFGMASLELVRPEAVAKLYARRGYRPTQRTYLKRL